MQTRYREHKRWFHKSLLVLQVPYSYKLGEYFDPFDPNGPAPSDWDAEEVITKWRDATVEDLQLIKELK